MMKTFYNKNNSKIFKTYDIIAPMGFYYHTLECGCETTTSTLGHPTTWVSTYCKLHSTSDYIHAEEEVKDLSNKIIKLRRELSHLENIYTEKQKHFQHLCGEKGHSFVAELDGDYHNSRYIYTCTRCDYFTQYKPIPSKN